MKKIIILFFFSFSLLWSQANFDVSVVNDSIKKVSFLNFLIDSSTGEKISFNYDLFYKPISYTQKSDLSFYEDKNLLIFFYSPTCPHCHQTIPKLLKLKKKMEKLDMNFVTISSGNHSNSRVADFVKKNKVDVPSYRDTRYLFSRNYGTGRVPVVLFVNKKGEVAHLTSLNYGLQPEIFTKLFSPFFKKDK